MEEVKNYLLDRGLDDAHLPELFNYEDFAKAILKYEYSELLSGKVAICKKGENSIIVEYDTKDECYDWVIQKYFRELRVQKEQSISNRNT